MNYIKRNTLKVALFVSAFAAVIGVSVRFSPSATAACGIATELGRTTSTITIGQAGTYKLWFRIKPADASHNAAYVQIDNGTCFKIGDNPSLAANTWAWVNYGQTGSTQTPISYNFTAGNHTLVIIGSEANIQIDRNIIVTTSSTCVPSNERSNGVEPGDNCLNSASSTTPATSGGAAGAGTATVVAMTKNGQPITFAANNATVSGDVVLDAAVATDTSVAKVEYFVGKKLIYTSTSLPFHLDTSVLKDGRYTITEKVTYKDGHTTEKTSHLTIKNKGTKTEHKSLLSRVLAVVGIGLMVLAAIALVLVLSPSLRQALIKRLSRITGRAIRF